ncbi:hypothetical protein [Amycolatopsis thermoflava]|uniref:hypothetical protein n=1 Tax=Amycolatopsis thermoflava TaxID=84480 RepID=UPI003EC00E22
MRSWSCRRAASRCCLPRSCPATLTVIERETLRQRVGEQPEDRELDEQAAILSTQIDTLGA